MSRTMHAPRPDVVTPQRGQLKGRPAPRRAATRSAALAAILAEYR